MENISSIPTVVNTTVNELPPLMFYSLAFRVVGTVVCAVVLVVGIIGNALVITVVLSSRTMRTTTNCYLVSLSTADLFVLISANIPIIPELYMIIDAWPYGHTSCSLFVFCQFLGVNASALSITAFSVERYVAICHPMKAQTLCTVKRAKRIIAGIWCFALAYNSCWLYLATIANKTYKTVDGNLTVQKCTYRLERSQYTVIYMTDLFLFYVFPLVLLCVLYTRIALILFRSANLQKPHTGSSSANSVSNRAAQKALKSRIQVVKMLAVVVIMFTILWLPYRSLVVYNSFATHNYQDFWFFLFCKIMLFTNSAVNPVIYNAMSEKFRRAFKRLLFCRRHEETRFNSQVNTRFTSVRNSEPLRMREMNGQNASSGTAGNIAATYQPVPAGDADDEQHSERKAPFYNPKERSVRFD